MTRITDGSVLRETKKKFESRTNSENEPSSSGRRKLDFILRQNSPIFSEQFLGFKSNSNKLPGDLENLAEILLLNDFSKLFFQVSNSNSSIANFLKIFYASELILAPNIIKISCLTNLFRFSNS